YRGGQGDGSGRRRGILRGSAGKSPYACRPMSTTPAQNPPPIPPDHPWAVPLSHLRHSLAAGRAGRQREAVAAALAAFKARVAAPELLVHLAGRLLELGEVRAMYACANDLSVVRGSDPQAGFTFANMLAAAGFPSDAL